MKKFIFDLDWTLYNRRDNIDESSNEAYYNSFKRKPFLKNLLKELKEDIYIFTNGNTIHAVEVLTRLGLKELFPNERIISRDNIKYLKPHPIGYYKVIQDFKISRTDEVYFFEDTIQNLLMAKKLGWKTILISDHKTEYCNYIDYTFSHIEEALLFFLVKKKFEKNIF